MEHIVNDARIITRENIARCCFGCNASKGNRGLVAWLQSNTALPADLEGVSCIGCSSFP